MQCGSAYSRSPCRSGQGKQGEVKTAPRTLTRKDITVAGREGWWRQCPRLVGGARWPAPCGHGFLRRHGASRNGRTLVRSQSRCLPHSSVLAVFAVATSQAVDAPAWPCHSAGRSEQKGAAAGGKLACPQACSIHCSQLSSVSPGTDRSAALSLRQSNWNVLLHACEGAGLSSSETGADPTAALSVREREVAELAARRMTSKEIAERLVLSTRTVDNHLQRIYTKLGVTSRRQLASIVDW
ncbi:helix-turn-helix transcriptional regulator [Streptomyces sp. NPDC004787]|uniref:helix-turn-helix transcriptional regulator n=1 Tax=Streptomyces sp. NPDC004787 TaxID=3154291 RepID=UPI0033B7C5E6